VANPNTILTLMLKLLTLILDNARFFTFTNNEEQYVIIYKSKISKAGLSIIHHVNLMTLIIYGSQTEDYYYDSRPIIIAKSV